MSWSACSLGRLVGRANFTLFTKSGANFIEHLPPFDPRIVRGLVALKNGGCVMNKNIMSSSCIFLEDNVKIVPN